MRPYIQFRLSLYPKQQYRIKVMSASARMEVQPSSSKATVRRKPIFTTNLSRNALHESRSNLLVTGNRPRRRSASNVSLWCPISSETAPFARQRQGITGKRVNKWNKWWQLWQDRGTRSASINDGLSGECKTEGRKEVARTSKRGNAPEPQRWGRVLSLPLLPLFIFPFSLPCFMRHRLCPLLRALTVSSCLIRHLFLVSRISQVLKESYP